MVVATRTLTMAQAIAEAIGQEMERDQRVFVLGEDVGIYEGIFGATSGLLQRFGRERIMDTPISETAFIGAATGAAAAGMRPIVELMFVDFFGVCMDQIYNHLAKNTYMSGGNVHLPVVLTTAIGGGYNDAAQHSQCLYGIFAHIPGLKVVIPSNAYDAKGLMKTAIRDNNPVVFIEDKMDYRVTGDVPDGEYPIPFGIADVKRAGEDVTLVGTSSMARLCLEAADLLAPDGISAEVVDPRTLSPLDRAALIESASKTGRAIVVDEGHRSYGVTAELAAVIGEGAFHHLDAPVRRLGALDVPVPFSPTLEDETVPTAELIAATARELCGRG